MKTPGFIFGIVLWLTSMLTMAQLGPIGQSPYLFGFVYVSGFAGMLLMLRQMPHKWSESRVVTVVILLGISGRLLFVAYPVGNDAYRYVWEGVIQNLGFNPYLLAPDRPELSEAARNVVPHIWERVNHRDFSAAYPPGFMLLCRVLSAIRPDPQFFKLIFTVFDIGTLLILVRMAIRRGIHPKFTLLYAANPLVIVFIAGEGHLDAVQTFWLCLGVHLVLEGRARSGYLALGLAVMSKYVSIVALPFLLTWPDRKRFWTFFIPVLLFLPYAQAGGQLLASLSTFGTTLHYNDFITALLRGLVGNHRAVLAAAVLLAFLCVAVYLLVHNRLMSIYLSIGCLLLCLPTLHPWYLCLIAPFMVFYPSPAWLYLQAAVCFTFPVLGVEFASGIFQEIPRLKLFEYVPFFALLLYGLKQSATYANQPVYPVPETVAVIIPTLDEGRSVGRAIGSVTGQSGLIQTIVVDGGSQDDTCQIARNSGATVIHGPRGRGTQVAAGVSRIRADVLMVLHADAVLAPGALKRVLMHLAAHPRAIGGAMGMRFSDRSWRSSAIAWLNNLRTRISGIAFGDQAQFFRSEILGSINGFPAVRLMEDVELSLRLKAHGPLLFLKQGVTVSDRRWQGKGFMNKFSLVVGLFVRFLFERRVCGGLPGHMDRYYRRYYGIAKKS